MAGQFTRVYTHLCVWFPETILDLHLGLPYTCRFSKEQAFVFRLCCQQTVHATPPYIVLHSFCSSVFAQELVTLPDEYSPEVSSEQRYVEPSEPCYISNLLSIESEPHLTKTIYHNILRGINHAQTDEKDRFKGRNRTSTLPLSLLDLRTNGSKAVK